MIKANETKTEKYEKTLVVFFHLSKTGGTTVKYIFNGTKGTSYHFATGSKKWNSTKDAVDKWFKGEKLKFIPVPPSYLFA